jgi:hypothetical protein
MQQGASRSFSHPRIAVSSPGHNALEKTEHAPHFRDPVKRSDNMHFGSTRIREAGINPSGDERAN